jgi:two-component system, chemotaxis family, sensor kinase CheA
MMPDPVFEIFREEAREHLNGLERGFLDLESTPDLQQRPELIDCLFRHAHSLKGDARAIGLARLQQAAQVLEDVLDLLREQPETVDRSTINNGLAQLDEVREAFEAWQGSGEAELQSGEGQAAVQPAERPATPAHGSEQTSGATVRDEAPQAGPRVAPLAEESFTVRVPSERLDRMLALAGEIRIAQRAGGLVSGRLAELRDDLERLLKSIAGQSAMERRRSMEIALDQVRQIETELRNARTRQQLLVDGLETDIRQARLLPLVMLTDSLRRAVRDLAQSLGKSIRYEVDVGQILLDKAVIEALREPLLHLIRNACDHGLESDDERRAAGKSPEGLLRIQASRRGERIRMTISDDGRGIDYQRVRDRLRRSGGLTEPELQELSEQDLAQYLFRPGFSTAEAGAVSGRGVGLDVVVDTIRRLQGNVELESSSPAGTTFALTVPVTVSTVRILTVLSNGQFYGVPSSSIVRTGRANQDDLRELEGSLVLPIDGQPARWVALAELLEIPVSRPASGGSWTYLLIAREGRSVAVVVDDLDEESEVLLKPLGFPLNGLPGIIGGTIRPDGSVQVVWT